MIAILENSNLSMKNIIYIIIFIINLNKFQLGKILFLLNLKFLKLSF